MLKKIIFYLCIGCLLTLQFSCNINKYLFEIGNQDIYKKGISPNYNKYVYANYKLNIKPEYMPFDNVIFIDSKNYGKENIDDVIDTLMVSRGPSIHETKLNRGGYIKTKKTFLENGELFYTDSLFYSFNSKKQLIQVKLINSRWLESNLIWNINYSKKGLIKEVKISCAIDSLSIERQYNYDFLSKKVISTTLNNKDIVINKTVYYFNRKGQIIKEIDERFLNNTVEYADLVYDSNRAYTRSWKIVDSTDVVIKSGYEKTVNNYLIETLRIDEKYNSRSHLWYEYTKNGLLSSEKHYDSRWSGGNDTTRSTFDYIEDVSNKKFRTIKKTYCEYCSGEMLNVIIEKYK